METRSIKWLHDAAPLLALLLAVAIALSWLTLDRTARRVSRTSSSSSPITASVRLASSELALEKSRLLWGKCHFIFVQHA